MDQISIHNELFPTISERSYRMLIGGVDFVAGSAGKFFLLISFALKIVISTRLLRA